MNLTIKDIQQVIGDCQIIGNPDLVFTGVATPGTATENDLIFVDGTKKVPKSKARICLTKFLNEDFETSIIVDNPKLAMAKIINAFFNSRPKHEFYKTHSQTSIGTDGFGYIKDESGQLVRFPHIGGVSLGKNVEMGSYVCIDRGTISDTIIRDNVKIDNLVHIAHNADIGEGTLIVAGTVVGGSVKIGKNCFIGMGALLKNGITIGDNVTVGMGAVVLNDIPSNEVWVGNPAKKIR